jgi:hypothetical protein
LSNNKSENLKVDPEMDRAAAQLIVDAFAEAKVRPSQFNIDSASYRVAMRWVRLEITRAEFVALCGQLPN